MSRGACGASRPRAHVVLMSAVALSAGFPSVAVGSDRPNVLFVSIDDLNDWVGFLDGHPQVRTPHMDGLARRGTVFANAHCAAPLCSPSRAAVFSGQQPFRTGVYGNEHNILQMRPELVLLPEYFQARGYRTYGAGKLLHQRLREGLDESFVTEQRWSPFSRTQVEYTAAELPSKGTGRPRHVIDDGPGGRRIVLPLNGMPSDRRPDDPGGESFDWGPLDVPDGAMGDARIVDWAIERLGRPDDGQPFFMAVGFYRPHIPLFAPRRYFEPYPAQSITLPAVREDDLDDLSPIARRMAVEPVTAGAHRTVVEHTQWREAVAAYLACVTFVDAQLGRLLDALDRGPHADETIIVLWSDHGWHLGEKQHWGKWTGWERSTRVPLIVAPARNASDHLQTATTCRRPVSLIDLYPTLIELCGLPASRDLDGVSLVPLLRDPAAAGRPVLTTFGEGNHTVRDDRWRLIRYADGSRELYDHERDPREWNNLAGDPRHAAVISRLEKLLPASE